MKMKHIAFAIAGMSFSLLANALTPTQIEASRVAGTLDQAWISGATAPTKTVYEAWAKGCAAGTITIYSTDTSNAVTPGSLGNYVAYACVRGSRRGVMYQTLDGGSLNAYTPHTDGVKLARIAYAGRTLGATGGCNATRLTYTDPTNSQNNAAVYKGCAQIGANQPATGATAEINAANAAAVAADPNAPQLPVGGFSDVEAALFPSTSITQSAVRTAGTQSNAFLLQGFGVAVSIPLYRKLQEAQGITEASGFSVANAPSLTKAQVASILKTNSKLETLGSWSPILGTFAGTQKVNVQRRVDTSGTQSASNAFFLGRPCTGSAALNPAFTSAASGLYNVTLNSGSSNVKSGITAASNASNPDDQYAIGVLSLENDYTTDNSSRNGYRFIKIDGVHPEEGDTTNNARVAIASGKYPFAFEMKTYVANTAPAGFARNLIPNLVLALKNPTTAAQCGLLPRGIALTPDSGNTACQAGVVRALTTKTGNNCRPAFLF